MREIILLGAGGHAAVILDILKAQIAHGEKLKIKGLLDDSDKLQLMGYPVLGRISEVNDFNEEDTYFIIAIGSNNVRYELSQKYSHLKYFTAIHPSAIIGSQVKISDGTVVMPKTVINANSQIGCHCIINTGAIVEHDNFIGDYVHLSPNATLCGTVEVQSLTHVGASAVIIQGKKIGSQTMIGAGSTVITDIPNRAVAVGTPAKIIKQY